jgi:hypothetical protein
MIRFLFEFKNQNYFRPRGRGRPLSREAKVLLATSNNPEEIKYCDMRSRNNVAGQMWCLKRKGNLEAKTNFLEVETIRNTKLKQKVRDLETLKIKLLRHLNDFKLTKEEERGVEAAREKILDFEIMMWFTFLFIL